MLLQCANSLLLLDVQSGRQVRQYSSDHFQSSVLAIFSCRSPEALWCGAEGAGWKRARHQGVHLQCQGRNHCAGRTGVVDVTDSWFELLHAHTSNGLRDDNSLPYHVAPSAVQASQHPPPMLCFDWMQGYQPRIAIYDACSLQLLQSIHASAAFGYSAVALSADGELLAVCGREPELLLTVWHWRKASWRVPELQPAGNDMLVYFYSLQ